MSEDETCILKVKYWGQKIDLFFYQFSSKANFLRKSVGFMIVLEDGFRVKILILRTFYIMIY